VIYYIAHWDWILKNSRSDIAKVVDFDVTGVAPLKDFKNDLKKDFVETIDWDYNRKKLLHVQGVFNLRKLLRTFNNNDIIHIFTLKSLLLYLFASIFFKKDFKAIASITGLGYLFANTILAKLIKFILQPFVRVSINSKIDTLIFQNTKNMEDFTKFANFLGSCEIIEGSGLNIESIELKTSVNKKLKIIFAGRFLKEKGYFEYLEIINKLSGNENFDFYIAGDIDPGNKSSISSDDLKELKSNPSLTYLGIIDIKSELWKYDILILPSYHEGFSRILLEAAYVGLFCIVNDLPGTETIIKKTNCGKLILGNKVQDYIDELLLLQDSFPYLDNINIRKNIENEYSVKAIAKKMSNLYKEYV